MRSIVYCAMALALTAGFGSAAHANSRFTVKNDFFESIYVRVFDGGDISCTAKAKNFEVKPGETKSAGCTGNGKQQCKITVKEESIGKFSRDRVCSKLTNTCGAGRKVINIANKQTLIVSGRESCTIE